MTLQSFYGAKRHGHPDTHYSTRGLRWDVKGSRCVFYMLTPAIFVETTERLPTGSTYLLLQQGPHLPPAQATTRRLCGIHSPPAPGAASVGPPVLLTASRLTLCVPLVLQGSCWVGDVAATEPNNSLSNILCLLYTCYQSPEPRQSPHLCRDPSPLHFSGSKSSFPCFRNLPDPDTPMH